MSSLRVGFKPELSPRNLLTENNLAEILSAVQLYMRSLGEVIKEKVQINTSKIW